MSIQWFYTKDGQRFGPVSSAELKKNADSGIINPTDQVWKDGMSGWASAANLKGLFGGNLNDSNNNLSLNNSNIMPIFEQNEIANKLNESSRLVLKKSNKNLKWVARIQIFVLGFAILSMSAFVLVCFSWNSRSSGFTQKLIALSEEKKKELGFTQKLIALSEEKKKEYGVFVDKNSKIQFSPSSIEDFLQTISMCKSLSRNDLLLVDYSNPIMNTSRNEHFSNYSTDDSKYVIAFDRLVSVSGWNYFFGELSKPKIVKIRENSSNTSRNNFYEWTLKCTNGLVTIRGRANFGNPSTSTYEFLGAKKGFLLINYLHYTGDSSNLYAKGVVSQDGNPAGQRMVFNSVSERR